MSEERTSEEELKELAEKAMADKREDGSDEGRTRELFDVPTESAEELAEEQEHR